MVSNTTSSNLSQQVVNVPQNVPFYSGILSLLPIVLMPLILGAIGGFLYCLLSFTKERKELRKDHKDLTLKEYNHEFWIFSLVGAFVSAFLSFVPSPLQQYIITYPAFYEFAIGFTSVTLLDKIGSLLFPS
jgi:hypothetical protein